MLDPREEILIQRCVDNECSPAERGELIERLDQSQDGWKTLACTYMEEQLFAAACREEFQPTTTAGSAGPSAPVSSAQPKAGHWFHHPAISMVLTACVVFLLGVIGAGEYQRRNGGDAAAQGAVAATDASDATGSDSQASPVPPPESMASRTVSNQPGSAWLETDGTVQGKLPVYSNVPEFMSSFERFRQQTNQWTESMGSRAPRSRIRYIQVQMGDELLLVPVEELSIEQNLQ
ncbi:MAG: hypothetical protein NXI04_20535 [Planctomycetaceae bacterium]|nr:hypothetical protein [Planctomycetaceae bacterium]